VQQRPTICYSKLEFALHSVVESICYGVPLLCLFGNSSNGNSHMNKTIVSTTKVESQSCYFISAIGEDSQKDHWFPLRVAYDQINKVHDELNKQNIVFFLPTECKIINNEEGIRTEQTPTFCDLIFVKSTKEKLTTLKHNGTFCRYLRFITFIPKSELHSNMTTLERRLANRIIIIPDIEMQNFMTVFAKEHNSIKLIQYSEAFKHMGRKIRILQGPLAGCVGTLRRIKNNKRVHVDCGGLLTAELGYMPKEQYELIEE